MNFQYRAYLKNGRVEVGQIDADGKQDALRKLAANGLVPFSIEVTKHKQAEQKSQTRNIGSFGLFNVRFDPQRLFSDLALLSEAGLTVNQALRSMRSMEANLKQRNVIDQVIEGMGTGLSAATAMSTIRAIPTECIGLIASAESAGRLGDVFRALAQQYEERATLRSNILNALAYPAFLIVLMVFAILVLAFVLVPSIEPLFDSSGRPPPILVAALSDLREFLSSGYFIVAILCSSALVSAMLVPEGRKVLSKTAISIALRSPVIGTVLQKTALAHYLSSFALMIGNGTSMAKALELAAVSSTIPGIQAKLQIVKDRVSAGERLPVAFANCGLFDDRIVSLIAVGDEANRLHIVAKRAAHILQSEAQSTTNRYSAMMTPAITIIMGLLIGGLVVSVMTALLSINEIAIQ